MAELKKGDIETKYGKKGDKKKESEDGGVFKENFLKYDEWSLNGNQISINLIVSFFIKNVIFL